MAVLADPLTSAGSRLLAEFALSGKWPIFSR
jgi:hypothetical protein